MDIAQIIIEEMDLKMSVTSSNGTRGWRGSACRASRYFQDSLLDGAKRTSDDAVDGHPPAPRNGTFKLSLESVGVRAKRSRTKPKKCSLP
jgi:hypothetical protein